MRVELRAAHRGGVEDDGHVFELLVVLQTEDDVRAVEIGQRGGLAVEIRSGLTEGERVVTHPDDALQEGAAVRIRAGR